MVPQYLSYLANHPSTARHLATKLARHFVSDSPSDALVTSLANVYLANKTAIAPVLKALFTSAEFTREHRAEDPATDRRRDRRGAHARDRAGGRRFREPVGPVLAAQPDGARTARLAAADGYPDVAEAWLSAGGMMRRWNAHLGLVGGWWTDGMAMPAASTLLGANPPATIGGVIDALATRLIGVPLAGAQRAAVVAFACSRTAGYTETSSSANLLRWDLGAVTSLILSSPNWIER